MKANFYQKGFAGGMNQLLDPTRIAENEYIYAHNVRSRDDKLEPVKQHVLVDTPEGDNMQGAYVFGEFMVLFLDGLAYYKDISLDGWTQIADFAMDDEAEFIYTEAVPSSSMNLQRKLTSAADTQAGATLNSLLSFDGSSAGLVCQDGINTPWLIYVDGSSLAARQIRTYAQWNNSGVGSEREYVPVGSKMLFHNGKLYVVNNNKIYHSITDRPLDFVVNVKVDGDKGGDADSTAYSVSDSFITCIQKLNTESFFIGTDAGVCFAVTPTRERTHFGEPTFKRLYLFGATCVNQFSFVDILGDFGFIDFEGLRSFNAVLQQQNEGRNSVFSLKLAKAFGKIRQDPSKVAAVVFNNYAIFCVLTAYGRNLVVYDTLYQTFVSFDFNTFGAVRQFVVASTNIPRLFGITVNNQLVEFYAATTYMMGVVKTREWTTNDPEVELRTLSMRPVFVSSLNEGVGTVTMYVDGAERPTSHGKKFDRVLPQNLSGLLYPVDYPALWQNQRKLVNLTFPFVGGVGFKVGYLLRWTGGATLSHVASNNEIILPKQANSAKVSQY